MVLLECSVCGGHKPGCESCEMMKDLLNDRLVTAGGSEIMGAFKDGVLQSSALFEIRF